MNNEDINSILIKQYLSVLLSLDIISSGSGSGCYVPNIQMTHHDNDIDLIESDHSYLTLWSEDTFSKCGFNCEFDTNEIKFVVQK